jgi:hypothetical protein
VHHDGVAVGCCFGHQVCANVAASSTFVVNRDGLPHRLRHLLRNDARHNVSCTARWERHNHFDGLGGIGLRNSTEGQCHSKQCDRENLFPLRKN